METNNQSSSKTREYDMRKVYLEGPLGQKFGEEWTLSVSSPAEALTAMMAQRPGMRQFLTESAGIQGYEVLIDNESIDMIEELVINDASRTQTYTFVPVIGGSKSSALMMVLGVTLIAMTGGMGAAFTPAFMGTAGSAAVGSTAAVVGTGMVGATTAVAGGATLAASATAYGVTTAGILATQGLGYLGMGLLLGGAAMMLAPDVPDGTSAEKAENYLFGGPVNTVKQGEPIPLVYGRAIVGSKTISASLFTNTSKQKLTAGRKMVGIPNFRLDGSTHGDTGVDGRPNWKWDGR